MLNAFNHVASKTCISRSHSAFYCFYLSSILCVWSIKVYLPKGAPHSLAHGDFCLEYTNHHQLRTYLTTITGAGNQGLLESAIVQTAISKKTDTKLDLPDSMPFSLTLMHCLRFFSIFSFTVYRLISTHAVCRPKFCPLTYNHSSGGK